MDVRRILIVVSLLVAACGGGEEPTAYKEMSFEQRRAFMEDVVLPEMTKSFVAFDPKFEGMSCATCHGDGAKDGSYAMPSPQLPVLPSSEAAFSEYLKDPEHARWSQFMMEQVWPSMSNLLQVPAFDPTTHPDGFSCSSCHTVEGAGH
jgi:hypothetical protein